MPDKAPDINDRLAMRDRPNGWPIMYQSWGSLLFLHWACEPSELEPHIPAGLSIDTFAGKAYLTISPFTLWDARPIFMPPLPLLSDFHEVNLRTYVHVDGAPGVYFFSLDANRLIPVIAARNLFYLAYREAEIHLERKDGVVDYRMERTEEPKATLQARWREEGDSFNAEPGSLEFFLVERYALYTRSSDQLYRCRIHHEPWPLRKAHLDYFETTLFEANGLPTPAGEPILQAGGPVHVEVWPLEELPE
jgi:uncharacterized protein YqjF (DUF2071 family)